MLSSIGACGDRSVLEFFKCYMENRVAEAVFVWAGFYITVATLPGLRFGEPSPCVIIL